MKKLLSKSKILTMGIFMLMAMAISILGFKSDPKTRSYKELSKEFDGQTIFKGVFFGEEAVGQFIPELVGSPKDIAKDQRMAKLIIEKIERVNPKFFDSFKQAMESGNPIKVDQAMAKAGELISNVTCECLGKESKANDSEGTIAFVVIDKPQDPTIWVPGPLWNWATAVYTDTDAVSGLDKDKVVQYLTNQLAK